MASALRFGTRFFNTVGQRQAYGLELFGAAAVTGGDPVTIIIKDRKDIAVDNGADHDRVHIRGQSVTPAMNDNILCSFTGAAAHVYGDLHGNAIVGTGLDDILEGAAGNDVLVGRGGNDQLLGGGNNDVLSDESGVNELRGGSGYDQIVFTGNLSAYSVTVNGSGDATVTNASFSDQIFSAEALVFADQTINLYELDTGLNLSIVNNTLVVSGDSAAGPDHGMVTLSLNQGSGGRGTFDLVDNGEIAIHTTLNVPSGFSGLVDASGLHGTGLSYDTQGTVIGSEQADDLGAYGYSGTLFGNGGDDVLYADGRSTLDGGAGDDQLSANSYNGYDDTLIGGAGNDLIDGSNGIDTAIYSGGLADYVITVHNGILTIADTRAGTPDGTDKVGNVEDFIFAGREYSIREVLDHVSPSSLGVQDLAAPTTLGEIAHEPLWSHHLTQLV